MLIARRWLLAMPPALAVGGITASGLMATGEAWATTTDLAVSCDTPAGPAVARAAKVFTARSGTRVRVHPTAPGLLLPQLERQIQNDILITQTRLLDQAEQAGLVQPNRRSRTWRNRLVLATADPPAGPEDSVAAPDPSPASDIDGAAILRRLGLFPIASSAAAGSAPSSATPDARMFGVLDTDAVAWVLTQGIARQGLLHQSEVAADPRLRVIAPVPDDAWPPILYAATVTRLANRPDPAAFVTFLGSAAGTAALHDGGLEIEA